MKSLGVVPTDPSKGRILHRFKGFTSSATLKYFGFVKPNHTLCHGLVVGVNGTAPRRLKALVIQPI